MNLGFIGTGKNAYSVITGICKSKIETKKYIHHSIKDEKMSEINIDFIYSIKLFEIMNIYVPGSP